MLASDAKKKHSNFDGLSFWLQNGYLLKLIFLLKERGTEKHEKSLLQLKEIPHVFPLKIISTNCMLVNIACEVENLYKRY